MDGKKLWQQGRHWLVGLMVLALAACGGSGGGSTYVPPVASATPTPQPYISSAVVSTVAGTLAGTDGTGAAASFNDPNGSVVVAGNMYVADSSNHTIRKIVINTGEVSTFAGSAGVRDSVDGTGTAARFAYPASITSDGANLYVADKYGYTIRKIVIATREVTTLAGSTTGNSGNSDGIGPAARFNFPSGIVREGGNLYVTDTDNHTIRKIVIATGEVSTFAGLAGSSGGTDATGNAARFNYPAGITSDGSNLYVADMYNCSIRKIVITSGVVSTLAGGSCGSADGTSTAASFSWPAALSYDNGNLYVADSGNQTIRKIVINTAMVSTFAGTAGSKGNTDASGSTARFQSPAGITSDGTRLFVTDTGSGAIRTIIINTAAVSTLAGKTYGANGIGQAARFYGPTGFTSDNGNLYVTDKYNSTIRKIVLNTGEVTTFAGSANSFGDIDGIGAAANFRLPEDITSDGTHLYVVDSRSNTIRKIVIATGVVTTLAGNAADTFGSDNGTGTAARFYEPSGIVRVGGDLYVVDSYNHTIRKIVIASGVVTTFAGTAGSHGSTDGVGTVARFYYPSRICSDGSNLYVTDAGNRTIRKIVIATGAVSTIAGSSGSTNADGIGLAAGFSNPAGITTDGAYLYITDSSNNNVRRLTIATGQVITLAGSIGVSGNADGIGNASRFREPAGIINISGSLYVADNGNNLIRKITGF